jgi:hypothetical protein
MRAIVIAGPMIMFALAAAAQIPSVPKLPTGEKPPISAPSSTPPSGPAVPGVGPSVPGAAQLPGVPKLPTGEKPSVAAPSATPASGTSVPGVGTSLPGAGQTSNPVDRLKTEAECKVPTNALKPECLELRLKK